MMQGSLTIDGQPVANVDLGGPGKIDYGDNGGGSFRCDLYDSELVHQIAQGFVPGLATACVDNTTGDIFRTPASVAAEVRREMVEYVTKRSESFVAESVILEGGQDGQVCDHNPHDIVSEFVDDFASSKRNLFSRVSGWLLSEKREDKIDDFVQEMEINGFWLVDKRETIAQSLLKNVDLKNEYHCVMKFRSPEELEAHVANCSYRSTRCVNEGCNAIFCARQADKHDEVCPFKIIPCEQNCSEMIMRRDMDRHCITVCLMKLVSCHFYAVGCHSPVPYCKLQQHCTDDLDSHMLFVLQSIYKESSSEDLKRRVEQLKDASSSNNLAQARDVRSLTSAVKDLEAKLGPMEVSKKQENIGPEHEQGEIASKAPAVVEPRAIEVITKLEEDLTLKSEKKEVNEQAEHPEARSEPKEVSTKRIDDVEAKPAQEVMSIETVKDIEAKRSPKEVSVSERLENVEARSVISTEQKAKGAEELSPKPAEDHEAKQAPREVSSSKPFEEDEKESVGVIDLAPTSHEDKPAQNELITKDLEAKEASREVISPKLNKDVEEKRMSVSNEDWKGREATQSPKQLSSKTAEDLETKQAPHEVHSPKAPEHEEILRTTEVRGKSLEELETKLGTEDVSTKPAEELETQLGSKEAANNESPQRLETNLGRQETGEGYEARPETRDVRSVAKEELPEQRKLGTNQVPKSLSFETLEAEI